MKRYRLKGSKDMTVLAMPEPGALSWRAGDFVVIQSGTPYVVPQEVAALFLEPVSKPATIGLRVHEVVSNGHVPVEQDPAGPLPSEPAVFVPQPLRLPAKRRPAKGYKRSFVGRSPATRWSVDNRKPLTVMQGRVLIRLYDATRDGPIRTSVLMRVLPDSDVRGAAPRLRELHLEGFIEVFKLNGSGHRYLKPSALGLLAVEMYGEEMRVMPVATGKKDE